MKHSFASPPWCMTIHLLSTLLDKFLENQALMQNSLLCRLPKSSNYTVGIFQYCYLLKSFLETMSFLLAIPAKYCKL
jgi:hypothetical protein